MEALQLQASLARPPRLLERVRTAIRRQSCGAGTERAYVHWIRHYILFHGKRHPLEMGSPEVEVFLAHLAVERGVSAGLLEQARGALVFLYRTVLGSELDARVAVARVRRPQDAGAMPTGDQVARVLGHLEDEYWLLATFMYGCRLQPSECLQLRVKDVDFLRRQVVVRTASANERVVVLPDRLREPLDLHLQGVRAAHRQDLEAGFGAVCLPFGLARRYPHAGKEWGWQYVFPAGERSTASCSTAMCRHHFAAETLQKALERAQDRASAIG